MPPGGIETLRVHLQSAPRFSNLLHYTSSPRLNKHHNPYIRNAVSGVSLNTIELRSPRQTAGRARSLLASVRWLELPFSTEARLHARRRPTNNRISSRKTLRSLSISITQQQSALYQDEPAFQNSVLCRLTATRFVFSCLIGLDGLIMLPFNALSDTSPE